MYCMEEGHSSSSSSNRDEKFPSDISNNNNNKNTTQHFESDIEVAALTRHRMTLTTFKQRSRNLGNLPRNLAFRVRLPDNSYVSDFKISYKKKSIQSRMVDEAEARGESRTQTNSNFVEKRENGCDEFHYRLRVLPGEEVAMTLTYETLLQRSKGQYDVELYRDPCHRHGKSSSGNPVDNSTHHHHHNNKIKLFKVDVVVKETLNIKNATTIPVDTSPMKVQSIIAGLSYMVPRSAAFGDDSGKTPVMLKRRRPNEIHYQFLYKDAHKEFYARNQTPPTFGRPLNSFLPNEIKLFYDVQRDDNFGEIQTRNDYFACFLAPSSKKFKPLDRDVVFLVDSSPSHLKVVNAALRKILETKLQPGDKFNILHFIGRSNQEDEEEAGTNRTIHPARDLSRIVLGMAGATGKNINIAVDMLNNFTLSYSEESKEEFQQEDTYYAEAREGLLRSLELLNRQKETDPYDTRLPIIFYVTSCPPPSPQPAPSQSSHPLTAEQERLLLSLERGNRANAVIIPIVLRREEGSRMNESHLAFLNVLARQNNGTVYIDRHESDVESFLLQAFDTASVVLLKDVSFKVLNEKIVRGAGKNNNKQDTLLLSPAHYPLLRDGEELIAAGRLHRSISHKTRASATTANSSSGRMNQHGRVFPAEYKSANFKMTTSGICSHGFVSFDSNVVFHKTKNSEDHDYDDEFGDELLEDLHAHLGRSNHLEKINTHLILKQLEEKIFLMTSRNEEEAHRLKIAHREMAKQHNLLVPGNCMLLEDPLGRNTAVCPTNENELQRHGAKSLSNSVQGSPKTFADNDPHFVVRVDGLTEHVCFDVLGKSGKFLQLLHDKNRDVTINALIVGGTNNANDHTYIGKISVISSEHKCIVVDTRWIFVNGTRYSWNANIAIELPGNVSTNVTTASRHQLQIERGNLVFRILRHYRGANKTSYLGFYVENDSELSHRADGLIGQFSHMTARVEGSSFRLKIVGANESVALRSRLTLRKPRSQKRTITAHLSYRRDMESRSRMACWHAGNEGSNLTGGVEKFLVPNLCHRGLANRTPN